MKFKSNRHYFDKKKCMNRAAFIKQILKRLSFVRSPKNVVSLLALICNSFCFHVDPKVFPSSALLCELYLGCIDDS